MFCFVQIFQDVNYFLFLFSNGYFEQIRLSLFSFKKQTVLHPSLVSWKEKGALNSCECNEITCI